MIGCTSRLSDGAGRSSSSRLPPPSLRNSLSLLLRHPERTAGAPPLRLFLTSILPLEPVVFGDVQAYSFASAARLVPPPVSEGYPCSKLSSRSPVAYPEKVRGDLFLRCSSHILLPRLVAGA